MPIGTLKHDKDTCIAQQVISNCVLICTVKLDVDSIMAQGRIIIIWHGIDNWHFKV